MAHLKTRAEIEKMRQAGRVVHKAIHTAGCAIAPGVTTAKLEDIASQIISDSGGSSPFLGYAPSGHPPFPAWTCISVNTQIVHGVPSDIALREGDIVTIDCGVELDGWIADSAWTFPVGDVSPIAQKLLQVTHASLFKGIGEARRGHRIGDIGWAIQRYAESHGFSVVRELTGHGVGKTLHEGLQIPNYGRRGKGTPIQAGMTLAIEPMLNAGKRDISVLDDKWTIVTADGSLSAHFEHTVAVTISGTEILTNGE